MRIAAIVEYFPPRLGGDRRIYELLKRLPSEKYEVTFLALPASYTLFIKEIDKEPLPDSETCIGGIRGVIIGYPRSLLKLWHRAFVPAYVVTLAYVLGKALIAMIRLSPDLIIVNNTSVYTGVVGYLMSLSTRKRLLVDFSDLQSEYTFDRVRDRVPLRFHKAVRLTLMVMENVMSRRSCKVITVHTKLLQEHVENICRKNIVYVPNGVDTEQFNPDAITAPEINTLRRELQIENTRICGYTGRIDREIGGEILYETLLLLERRHERIKCLILGEGDPDLLKKIKRLNVVVYVGLKPAHEVPRYIALADVILVPYPRTKASHFVSPLKLFEALAMGKPVVASAVSGIRDVILSGQNGILVDDDPVQWVQTIERILEENSLSNKLATNAIATARRYDWRHLSERFEQAIDMALGASLP